MKASTGRKLKYGGTSIALTALIIAVVIIVNVIFSLLANRFTWYLDLTPELKFTISDECYDLIGAESDDDIDTPIEMVKKFREENKKYNADNGLKAGDKGYRDENVKINILFLKEKDHLTHDSTMNYVVVNAEELRAKFDGYVTTEYKDSTLNPSRFKKYLNTNTDTIAADSVIIECGTEYRIRTLRSFFIFENAETPIAYNGEKAFASSILAVTRAEAPLACYTTNHNETFPESTKGNGVPFLNALEDAGYEARPINLATEEIPEECRMLIVFDPKNDFSTGNDGITDVSELSKLDDFLQDRNSLMVFMNPEKTGSRLNNFEDFLEEWGLAFRRDGDDPYMVKDSSSSLLGSSSAFVAEYTNDEKPKAWMADMLNRNDPPKVVFSNAAAISYAPGYDVRVGSYTDEESGETYKYQYGAGTSYGNGKGRYVHDIFLSSNNATAWAADREVAQATNPDTKESDPFKLMCVATETFVETEYAGGLEDSAFVFLCGSTDFANEKYLGSNVYGNSDFLLTALSMMGREPVPVGLKYKNFANYEIQTVEENDATAYTVFFTVAPLVITLFAGVFVIVRRKNR